jgi:hypothetical protein
MLEVDFPATESELGITMKKSFQRGCGVLLVDYYFQSEHSTGNTKSLAISEPAIGEIMEMAGEDSSIPQGDY